MNKQTLIRDIKATLPEKRGFINQTEIENYLGKGDGYVKRLVSGLEGLKSKKGNRYPISDVAERIMKDFS